MEYRKEHFRLTHCQEPDMFAYAIEGERRYVVQLHPHLKSILDAELNAGNRIVSATGGWPEKGSIMVSLEKPFLKQHTLPDDVTYVDQIDYHDGLHKYICGSPEHTLIC